MSDAAQGTKARVLSALALVVSVAHFATFNAHTRPLVSDVRYYLYFAWRTSEGAVPHVDLFDNKTQLATFLGALFYSVGDAVGADPLLAIRYGYLALAALGGWLAFVVLRALGGRDHVAGFLGLLAFTSFVLLGVIPSIGNVPKLAMTLAATGVALATFRGRWVLAGALGTLAFWDWQIGAVAWIAAFATACVAPGVPPGVRSGERKVAARGVVLGGALGMVPFVGYYAASGALGALWDQVVAASFFRGTSSIDQEDLGSRLERISRLIELDTDGRAWLVYASAAGVVVCGSLLWKLRRDPRFALLLPLAVYHALVGAFNLLDFQWHGDLFSLLFSVAFFQGLAWYGIWSGVRCALGACSERRRNIAAGAVLLTAVLVCRPGPLHGDLELELPMVKPGVTLADQREVAEALRPRLEAEPFALVEFSELLFLLRRENPVPFIYWNNATWSTYRASADEEKDATLARLLRELDVDLFTYKKKLPSELLGARFPFERIESANGNYEVWLQAKR